jgi:hypothetical protein
VHLGLGDVEAALAALEQAYDERDLFLIWLRVDPRYDAIAAEPRVCGLLDRMHLG